MNLHIFFAKHLWDSKFIRKIKILNNIRFSAMITIKFKMQFNQVRFTGKRQCFQKIRITLNLNGLLFGSVRYVPEADELCATKSLKAFVYLDDIIVYCCIGVIDV